MTRHAILVAALVLGAAAWIAGAHGFAPAWLATAWFLLAWPLGCMLLTLVHALTGGSWGETLRPALRLGIAALPVALIALLPAISSAHTLFPWAHDPDAANFYRNPSAQLLRLAMYVVAWATIGWICLRSRNPARASPFALCALVLSVTFAAVDANLALDRHFFSSIYGMIVLSGMALVGMSTAILLTPALRLPDRVIGKLLLALVILWTYLDFMQFLIVWQSNLPQDAPWYAARAHAGWHLVGLAIAVLHVALPFAWLLSPARQCSARGLKLVAATLLIAEVLRAWWVVVPSAGLALGWQEPVCLAALGGIAWWCTGTGRVRGWAG